MSKKISINAFIGLSGFLFSLGIGLIFFGINYEYNVMPITIPLYQWTLIIGSLFAGFVFMILGTLLLAEISGVKEKNNLTEKKLRQIIREEIILNIPYVSGESKKDL